jgi:putative glutamine amidotransferase
MGKPRIAMTTWRRIMPTFLNDQTDLFTLASEYPQSILDAGGLPLLLPHHHPDDAARVLEGFDGLVMVGGDDIDPRRYGQENTGLSTGVRESADASDLAFARAAVELGVPMFGICRGFQILNVAMGGTMHQDSTSAEGIHQPISSIPTEVMGARHSVEIEPSSRLAAAYKCTQRIVNSIHHQSIDEVAPGFKVVARAPDGTIEAIEPDDQSARVLAVQWHPEKITAEGDDVLFTYFINDLVRS